MPKPDELLARGVAHFNAGRYSLAAKAFAEAAAAGAPQAAMFLEQARRAEREDPKGFDADANAFRAAARAGRAAGMAAAARRLEARSPARAFRAYRDVWLTGRIAGRVSGRSPWSAFLRSARLWRAGKNEAALGELERAAAADGFDWLGYQAAEVLLRRLENADAALARLARVRAAAPWLWEASCLEAEIRAGRGEPGAVEALDALSPPESSATAFRAWRGALKLWTRGGTSALADLEAASATADGLGWRGAAKAHAGDLEGALSDLNARLESEADPEALCWRGETLAAAGRPGDARRDFADALAVAPGWFWARIGRALCEPEDGGALDEDWRALTGEPSAPEGARAALAAARAAARGLRRPDAHLQGFWLGGAQSPGAWLLARA